MYAKRFNQKDLARIFPHISPRTLLSWAKLGILGWADETVNGRGRIRHYDLENCYQVKLIEELSSLNVPLDLMRVIMQKLLQESGGIAGNLDSCVVIYKTRSGYDGWDHVPPVSLLQIDEMWQILKPVLMAPVWEYPAVIILSLKCVADKVNELVKAETV
jgi:DNA-binding transcriptional MerR regulator